VTTPEYITLSTDDLLTLVSKAYDAGFLDGQPPGVDPEYFWSRFRSELIVPELGPCLIWAGRIGPNGYGVVSHRGRPTGTHRVAYELSKGPIPPGLLVRHRCDVKACGRDEHLILGTIAQNNADARERGLVADIGKHARGERVNTARLTRRDVEAIIAELRAGTLKAALAKRYGVRRGAITKIALGQSWKHIPREADLQAIYQSRKPKRRAPAHFYHRGEDAPMAKLTEEQVREIRRRHAHESRAVLAQAFGVHERTIYAIVHRHNWKHVA
jgi:hypothetical protein